METRLIIAYGLIAVFVIAAAIGCAIAVRKRRARRRLRRKF